MGHEPDLAVELEKMAHPIKISVEVVDILKGKELQFKRDSEAQLIVEKGKLKVKSFYPMNLLGKLSMEKTMIGDWRELVDSIMIDFHYDGVVLNPTVVDVPDKNNIVDGSYPIPDDHGHIRVKITDVLSESIELDIEA
jgi:site-specific DNA-methyltransferase (adenine-specific)/adenine-specific DNA-methyltransferase